MVISTRGCCQCGYIDGAVCCGRVVLIWKWHQCGCIDEGMLSVWLYRLRLGAAVDVIVLMKDAVK